ncbi:MAG: IPTL-CTERM sorting domain-containing protein [Betaproteobacteria bacterium]
MTATGGTIVGPLPGGDGRFIFCSNNSASFAGTVTGAAVTNTTGPLRFVLPHDPSIFAPFIPNLVLGPEAYGRAPFTTDIDFANIQLPPGAHAAILKVAIAPKPLDHAFNGYSYLFVLNPTNKPLIAPKLLVSQTFPKSSTSPIGGAVVAAAGASGVPSMADGGPANDPAFGGGGPIPLNALAARGVYVALVPDGPIDVVLEFVVSGGVVRQSFAGVGDDTPVFVTAVPVGTVGIPATSGTGLALLALLIALAAWRMRRRA